MKAKPEAVPEMIAILRLYLESTSRTQHGGVLVHQPQLDEADDRTRLLFAKLEITD